MSQHEGQRLYLCLRVCARQEAVVSLALQCLQTGNVYPRQKGRNLAAPHGKHWESGPKHTHTHTDIQKHTHTQLQQCKKEESDGSEEGYLV